MTNEQVKALLAELGPKAEFGEAQYSDQLVWELCTDLLAAREELRRLRKSQAKDDRVMRALAAKVQAARAALNKDHLAEEG